MAGMRFFDITDTPDLEANAQLAAFTKKKSAWAWQRAITR